jgi:glycosyltransferase involved in cell wall biosynthesis
MRIDLSVIIPCHNEATTLPQQLDALARQVWDGSWEVLVVDNQSTDQTSAVALSHSGLAGRLRTIDAPHGRGVSYARRAGVEASTAKAVVFCDGDDVVADNWVATMGMALREHPIVTGEVELERLNDPALVTSRGTPHVGRPPVYGPVIFLRGNNGGMQRSVWDQLGGFDESFNGLEDIEFSLRARAEGFVVDFVPDALVHYRYRVGWRPLWNQGLFYGCSYPQLWKRCLDLGLDPPSRFAGVRSWAWIALHIPLLMRKPVRIRWVWTLSCRIGALRGALRYRLLYL